MILDVRTLFIAVAVACFTEVLTVLVVWATNRRVPGTGYWTFGTILAAAAMPLFLFQGYFDNRLLTYVLPNVLFQTAMVMLCMGAFRFTGRRAPVGFMITGSVATLALLFWFIFGHESLAWRIMLASAWGAVLFLMNAVVLWRHGGKGSRASTRLTAIGFAAAFAMMIYRIAIWMGDAPDGWISGSALGSSLLALLALVMSYIWIFCILYMVSQFRTQEIKVQIEGKYAVEQQLLEAKNMLEKERGIRMRQMVARDLHDGIGGITAAVATLAGLGRSEIADDRKEILATIEEMATAGSREIRDLMGSVESGMSRWSDWLADIEVYASRITEGMGIEVAWEVEGEAPEPVIHDQAASASLMKVVFEALHNLVRHSGAAKVWVAIRFNPKSLEIVIRDNGQGFEGEREGGRGISNMRDRVGELGGTFSIKNKDGALLRVQVPLPLRCTDPVQPSVQMMRTKKTESFRKRENAGCE